MTAQDIANYTAKPRAPTHVNYRGLDVYGMAPPSSGGITVGEALNILSRLNLSAEPRAQALFQYLEASRLAFADRNAYIGDSGLRRRCRRPACSTRPTPRPGSCLIKTTR